jgi:uridylate kinase
MRITLCVGGSVLAPDGPDTDFTKRLAEIIRRLKQDGHELSIVVGGGGPARLYIEAGQRLMIPSLKLDELGIAITRLNAKFLILALGDICEQKPLEAVEGASFVLASGKIPVMGGTTPGQTTDAVAAMLASSLGSDLLIFVSNVDGIYDKDPKKYEDAKKIREMKTSELVELFGRMRVSPGMNVVIDPVAAKLIHLYKLKCIVIGRDEIDNLPAILSGKAHSGTTILPGE